MKITHGHPLGVGINQSLLPYYKLTLAISIDKVKQYHWGMSYYSTGVRETIDNHLIELSKERRDYKEYWPGSSAGYCYRKVIFDRLQVPLVDKENRARVQRVFSSGKLFHDWIQGITKETGISIDQEIELKDEDLKILGHADDLVKVGDKLILYDYKSQSSRAFGYQKGMSHFHRLQLGTYLYMIRNIHPVEEGRILKISKDDMRLSEEPLIWDIELEHEVLGYWTGLNHYWDAKTLPPCTCSEQEHGFMAKEAYNPYYFNGEPCSEVWMRENGIAFSA